MIYFIHNVLTNMFRPVLLPSSGWRYYYKKCEELYDTSNKEYSDCVERKIVGQIGEEVKKIPQVPMFFIAHFEVTITLSSPKL